MLSRLKRFCGVGDNGEWTYCHYWRTSSTEWVAHPPDLSHRHELELGDVFMHAYSEGVQFWLWVLGRDREPRWKPVRLGFAREDRRVLAMTEKSKLPSWLDAEWYQKRLHQSECLSDCDERNTNSKRPIPQIVSDTILVPSRQCVRSPQDSCL